MRSEEKRLFSQAKHRLYNSTIQGLEQFFLNHYHFKRVSRLAITFRFVSTALNLFSNKFDSMMLVWKLIILYANQTNQAHKICFLVVNRVSVRRPRRTPLPKPSWVAYPAVNVVQILSLWTGVNEILLHASHAMVPKHLQEILYSKTIKFKFMFVYGTLHFTKDFFNYCSSLISWSALPTTRLVVTALILKPQIIFLAVVVGSKKARYGVCANINPSFLN